MAIRSVGNVASANTAGLASKELGRVIGQPDADAWVRNPSWPPCEANVGDKKMVGLYAVWPTTGNFVALTAQNAYTVDWGDGTVTNYSSGNQANYEFNYSAAALVGTEAPVTLNASTNTVDRTAHGYTNGMKVTLYSVSGTSAVASGRPYFVVNATANTFQVSLTSGGSAIAFGTNGTANLLPYRVATVTITPQAGQTLTNFSTDVRYSGALSVQAYAPMWLDIVVAAQDMVNLLFGAASGNVSPGPLERVRLKELSPSISSFANTFNLCRFLRRVEITADTTAVTSCSAMFSGCISLTEVGLFNTSAVTTFSNMFNGCSGLRRVPAFNTTAANNLSGMFSGCSSLVDVPSLNAPNATSASSMFFNCSSLITAPSITFSSALTSTSSMFNGCRNLKNVPLYNFQGVTGAGSMFSSCVSLESVPPFNLQSATSIAGMFNGCVSLKSVQLFTTAALTNTSTLFSGCSALREAPSFNTSGVTTATSTFAGCSSLISVPEYNFPVATDLSTMFANCTALTEGPRMTLSSSALNLSGMFNGCTSLVKCPTYTTPNVTNMSSMFNTCSSLIEAPMLDTSKVTNASSMFANCTALTYVPLYDLGLATTVQSMFSSCNSLDSVPAFNFSSATNVASTFTICRSLVEVPAFNLNAVTSAGNFTSFVNTCSSLARFRATNLRFSFSLSNCKMSKSALEEVFANLPTVSTTQTVTVTGNYGVGEITSRTSTTTSGSTTVTLLDTGGISVGYLVLSNNLAINTPASGTADVSTDTITRTAHGLANGTKVSFSALGTVTGVSINTIYYVVNAATDTFQVAATAGGAAIDLTGTGGSVSFRYPVYVVSIVPATSVTLSAPAVASGAVATSYRALDVSDALMKNWGVTT